MTLWDLLVWALVISFVLSLFYGRNQHKEAVQAKQELEKSKNKQMASDIQATKTSRVVDQVEIVDELGAHTQNFRQYCELVGTAMKEGGVTAPYSGRQVAYYDVKCYRLENIGGRERETLVAHETSIEPFYFKDSSCETPVYVDIKSFGENMILVNSTNHVEGPNSNFTNAFNANTGQRSSAGGSSQRSYSRSDDDDDRDYDIVGRAYEAGCNWMANALDALRLPRLSPSFALAYAGAGAGYFGGLSEKPERGARMLMSKGIGGALGGPGGGGRSFGGGGNRGGVHVSFGGPGLPTNLGGFLGAGRGFVYGFPTSHYGRRTSGDLGEVLVGMTLAQLLRSMNSTPQRPNTTAPQSHTPQTSFQGYRIVEDVVPLGSPIYAIGELYRAGTDIYMGRSIAADYPTSFFACRPEAEVLTALAE